MIRWGTLKIYWPHEKTLRRIVKELSRELALKDAPPPPEPAPPVLPVACNEDRKWSS